MKIVIFPVPLIFVPKSLIDNNLALVQKNHCLLGSKRLSEPIMVSFRLTLGLHKSIQHRESDNAFIIQETNDMNIFGINLQKT